MFSGLTNQMSSWIGRKQEGEEPKPTEESPGAVPSEAEVGSEGDTKKETSPTKASRLDMLGSIGGIGGSVKSQMSSWLPSVSIPGLKKGDTAGDQAATEETPAEPQPSTEKVSSPTGEKGEDEDSSATEGADSDAHLSEGEEGEDKDAAGIGGVSTKAIAGAKSFGSFLYSAVNKAGKTVSEAGAKIKKTVEENSLLGEFNREQEAFLKEKQSKSGEEAAVPPWVGRPNEESLKEECLSLSTDRRNFVRAPPSGVDFQFDLETQSAMAMATLAEDPNLEKMRFELVPKVISEENFWRNYFYRVSLICQANEVSSMAQEGGGSLDRNSSVEAEPTERTTDHKEKDLRGCNLESSPQHEFVSDTFAASTEDMEEVKEGLKKLGIGTGAEEEWEKELEAELQDYEMVASDTDKNLDNQIESELADLK